MLTKKEITVYCVILASCMVLYFESALRVHGIRDQLNPAQTISALMVRPEVLEIVSGQYKGLLADYLLVKASVYLGGRYSTPDKNKHAVVTLFRQSATLDPYFFQTCYFVQGIVPWWGGEYVHQAIDTLEISKQSRTWDWQPGFFIGFDYFYFLKENKTASRYLMETAEVPSCPPLIGFLGSRMSQRGGDTMAGIAFLKSMLESTQKTEAMEAINQRIRALEGILTLERAIRQFKSMFLDHPPDKLEQLVEAGILKELPVNPARRDGLYLYEDGKINF